MDNLAQNLDSVVKRIEKARLNYDPLHIVSLIAVSKYSDMTQIQSMYQCGQRAFGENKVQDLAQKSEKLESLPIQWHFIGNLQSNKINALISLKPTLFQALDTLKLAIALDERLGKVGQSMKCLMEINISGESSKGGVDKSRAIEQYLEIKEKCPNIILEGIMTLGANTPNRHEINQNFYETKQIFDKLQSLTDGVKTLSMGMSGDFELAISNGANLVRIGSELFK